MRPAFVTFLLIASLLIGGCQRKELDQVEKIENVESEKWLGAAHVKSTNAESDDTDAVVSKEAETSIREFFDEFSSANKAELHTMSRRYVDVAAMIKSMRQQDLIPAPESDDEQLVTALTSTFRQDRMKAMFTQIGWERVEIRSIQTNATETQASIFCRQWDVSDISSKMRWDLIKRDGKWRVYDFDMLEMSLRLTQMLGVGFKMADTNDPSVKHIPTMLGVVPLLQTGDVEGVIRELNGLETANLPPVFESMRLVILSGAYSGLDRFQESLDAAKRAQSGTLEIPYLSIIEATCHNGLGNHARAKELCGEYAKFLGRDAEYYTEMGAANQGIGDLKKARELYELAFDDDPQFGEAVFKLMLIAETDQMKEVQTKYEQLNDVELWFEGFADILVRRNDQEGLRRLIEMHRNVEPGNPDIAVYEEILNGMK